ncbi:hypothetical protein ABZS61_11630 [Streptomyces sp. NPDC005566]|uniref:hypothetical protein n=1 Tax=Streptomyces sp. NPDC005566 TaxID=3156886 RepID=UPI0033AA934F
MTFTTVDSFIGHEVTCAAEVIDGDGDAVGLQLNLVGGESCVLTDWTDWTLRVERRSDQELPDYFWPPDKHALRVLEEYRQGVEITSVESRRDEMGETIGVVIRMGAFGGYAASAHADGFTLKKVS